MPRASICWQVVAQHIRVWIMSERSGNEERETDVEMLLRAIGPRDEPSPEVVRGIRDAVHAEWQASIARHRRARRERYWAMAASLLVILAASIFGVERARNARPPIVVATVDRVDGELYGAVARETLSPRAIGASVSAGERLQTNDRSRAVLRYPGNVSVRLDRNTVVSLAAADRIALVAGALYIDSAGDAGTSALIVQTHAAAVRHIGTQYQVRAYEDDVDVDVREGRVAIRLATSENTAQAGESIRVTNAGRLVRSRIAPWDQRWAWTTQIAPAFVLDNASVADFLEWYAHETGRRLVYRSPEAQYAARTERLHGSVAGFDPETALRAVLPTTRFHLYEAKPDSIGIELTPTTDPGPKGRPTG
jgi:ferric-dicitrate binding protein FerR (iron transport regulator)